MLVSLMCINLVAVSSWFSVLACPRAVAVFEPAIAQHSTPSLRVFASLARQCSLLSAHVYSGLPFDFLRLLRFWVASFVVWMLLVMLSNFANLQNSKKATKKSTPLIMPAASMADLPFSSKKNVMMYVGVSVVLVLIFLHTSGLCTHKTCVTWPDSNWKTRILGFVLSRKTVNAASSCTK